MPQYIVWNRPETDIEIVSFRILRSLTPTGLFEKVKEIPAKENNNWNLEFIDNIEGNYWYIIEYIGSSGNVISKTNPIQGEITASSKIDLLYKLRNRIGDIVKPYAFSDWELLDQLQEALFSHNKNYTWNTLPEEEEYLVLWLAISQLCLLLATDSSKYYNLTIDGVSVDKSNRVEKYLELHNKYLEKYNNTVNKQGIVKEGSGEVIEGYLTRKDIYFNKRVPFIHTNKPASVRLFNPINITAGSVQLKWTKSYSEDFQYYLLFRCPFSNILHRVVEENFYKRMGQQYYYTGSDFWLMENLVFTCGLLYNNDMTMWTDYNNPRFPTYNFPEAIIKPESTWYYVIVVFTRNGLISISNEVEVKFKKLLPPEIDKITKEYILGKGEPDADIELEKLKDRNWELLTKTHITPKILNAFKIYVSLNSGDKVRLKQKFLNQYSDYTDIFEV